jgi:predicted short-subunit dehydrogenase-like oxidoreductase (DUF2520 family)
MSRSSGVRVRILGAGRAGSSLAKALRETDGFTVELWGREESVAHAADNVDYLFLAVPDDVISNLASAISPSPNTIVSHMAGSLTLSVLSPHTRKASLHPLAMLSDTTIGALRLRSGITFAIDGDDAIEKVVASLGGKSIRIAPQDRPRYHAAAAIAANHTVGLLGQVERLAATLTLTLSDFLSLVQNALDDASTLGPRRALTGPAARGDWTTLARHLEALPENERSSYRAGVGLSLALAFGSERESREKEFTTFEEVRVASEVAES